MPSIYYQRQFIPGCYYHVYNRGAHQQLLFHDKKDYQAFTEILRHYILHPLGTPPSIISRESHAKFHKPKIDKVPNFVQNDVHACNLLAYCLMPNHFHLMLQQIDKDITITNLMRRLSIGYAMYYNSRHHHSGTILQGKYKNILIESEVQWYYLTKYIHLNPAHLKQSSELCPELSKYPYSSYQHYLGIKSENWIDNSEILGRYHQNPFDEYRQFVEDSDPGPIERYALDSEELQD